MHRHDLDLIAALADGSLEDESKATALVTSCEECRSEYESQTAILATLAKVGPAGMTDIEKAGLHRDLWTTLSKDRAPVDRPVPWWYRWSFVAVGLFVVVGLAGVLTQLGGEGDALSTAAFEETAVDLDGADDSPDAGESESGGSAVEAPENNVNAQSHEDGSSEIDPVSGAEDFSQMASGIRKGVANPVTSFSSVALEDRVAECLEKAGLDELEVTGKIDESTQFLLAVPADEPVGDDTVVTVIDFTSCEAVHVDG